MAVSPSQYPNFLVVMTDQQRSDAWCPDLSGWTPNLARFAREGLCFNQTYCPSPHCCPSRATFFTGEYPSRHGVWNNVLNGQALATDLSPTTRPWSEDLAAAGYQLHFSGKWHVSARRRPSDFGWREHFVSAVGDRDYHGPRWADYAPVESRAQVGDGNRVRPPGTLQRPGYGDATLFETLPRGAEMPHDEDAVAGALGALESVRDRQDPWMIYTGLFGPHDPYAVAAEWIDRIPDSAVTLPDTYYDTMTDKPGIYRRMRRQVWGQFDDGEVIEARRHYLAYCAYVDHQFGRVLRSLRVSGLEENTVVLFLSDHGDYQGEHGLFCKGIPAFNGAYRVPNFIRWPRGLVSPDRKCDALVSLADIGPTLLELAGVAYAEDRFSGSSLCPWLCGETEVKGWRDCIVTQCNGVELGFSQRSVQTPKWKYVFNGFDEDELYCLQSDPGETVNRIHAPSCSEVVRDLCRRLWTFSRRERDSMINDYFTVALAPHGPATADFND
jgi:arylsulfatase A-like enzyme